MGGTGASKTISILIWHIDYAQTHENEIMTIGSESYPHLSLGAIRDFKGIMKDRGYWKDERWNETNHRYEFETGTIIEFLSVDTYGKAHGPRRDTLYLNECNNIPYNIARQLMLRTRKIVWLDWNPTAEFWYNTELEGKREDIDLLHLTFKDNEALDEGTKAEILAMQNNKYLWNVYGLGVLGEAEGKIYKEWRLDLEEVPHEARLLSRGLDFGYKNDPTSIVDIYYHNGGYILDEIAFSKGLSNKQISDIITALPAAPVYADSAEPKSIDELRLYGITVIASTKGKGSVSQGIQFVQAQRISVTKRSVNIIKEYRNYLYLTDNTGKITNEPNHAFSHAMDAIRYGLQIKSNIEPVKEYVQPPYEGYGTVPPQPIVEAGYSGEFVPKRR